MLSLNNRNKLKNKQEIIRDRVGYKNRTYLTYFLLGLLMGLKNKIVNFALNQLK